MDVVRWLRESGVAIDQPDVPAVSGNGGLVLDVLISDTRARFAVEQRGRAPYPNEIAALERSREALAGRGSPLLAVPFVSEAVGAALTGAGWSWADEHGDFDLRAPGLVLRQRRAAVAPPAPRRDALPRGTGSFAVIRALISAGVGEEARGATALAAQARVSQPRASQVLHRLLGLGLVERTRQGRWDPDRAALLDRFLAEYPGAGGSELPCYSLDAPADVAVRAARAAGPRRPVAISADVGPDLVVPWRRPSVVIVYAGHLIDTAALGLVEAQGRHDANVIVRMPADQSVFPVPALTAGLRGTQIPLADPSQMLWDLRDLGGADRPEVEGRLRTWLLTGP
jgi:DNA-binding transcriptional ArsR family regulator